MNKSEDHKDNKKLLKLDNIPRENIHKTPEGYFDELPGIIQARVTQKSSRSTFWQTLLVPATGWKVALATAVLALILVFSIVFESNKVSGTVDEILAEVSLEDLIEYVEYSDITTDDILAELDMSEYELDDIMGDDIMLLDEMEFENLDQYDLYEVYGIDEDIF
jgi:hypothetical protein